MRQIPKWVFQLFLVVSLGGTFYAVHAEHDMDATPGIEAHPPAPVKDEPKSVNTGAIKLEQLPDQTRLQFVNTAIAAPVDELVSMNASSWSPFGVTGDVEVPPQPLGGNFTSRGPQPLDFQ